MFDALARRYRRYLHNRRERRVGGPKSVIRLVLAMIIAVVVVNVVLTYSDKIAVPRFGFGKK